MFDFFFRETSRKLPQRTYFFKMFFGRIHGRCDYLFMDAFGVVSPPVAVEYHAGQLTNPA